MPFPSFPRGLKHALTFVEIIIVLMLLGLVGSICSYKIIGMQREAKKMGSLRTVEQVLKQAEHIAALTDNEVTCTFRSEEDRLFLTMRASDIGIASAQSALEEERLLEGLVEAKITEGGHALSSLETDARLYFFPHAPSTNRKVALYDASSPSIPVRVITVGHAHEQPHIPYPREVQAAHEQQKTVR